MTPIISLMAIGVSAFAATNIDDIFRAHGVLLCIDSSSSIEY
jgi:hypothetical protein